MRTEKEEKRTTGFSPYVVGEVTHSVNKYLPNTDSVPSTHRGNNRADRHDSCLPEDQIPVGKAIINE